VLTYPNKGALAAFQRGRVKANGGLILVGFAGALRRSEIATVNIKGVSFTKHGSRNFPEIARQQ
jgi:hypothetical protein